VYKNIVSAAAANIIHTKLVMMNCIVLVVLLIPLNPCLSMTKTELLKIRETIASSNISSDGHHGYAAETFLSGKYATYTGDNPVFVAFGKFSQLHIGNGELILHNLLSI
jgi:hypothetical protein